MAAHDTDHLTLWNLSPQQLLVDFQGGQLVADAGLLAVRALERPLRVLGDLAPPFPDPRSPTFVHHSEEALLTQEVYALLAGYPDSNDADDLRNDALFQILADVSPAAEQPLASGSTLARFPYAYTRRQAKLPLEERAVLLEVRAAPLQRLKVVNHYLADLFSRTRTAPPTEVLLDVDATDDPVHGGQSLSGYHGPYHQHQHWPLHVYKGHRGFPLAVWLRPGVVHVHCGALDILRPRGRGGGPLGRACASCCVPTTAWACRRSTTSARAGLDYVIGYAGNAVLERATAQALAAVELYHRFYGYRDPQVQRFEEVRDYPAGGWPPPRRVIAKGEINPRGSQRRKVVTNRTETAAVV